MKHTWIYISLITVLIIMSSNMLATDYTKVGTNYYTGGNFVESTLTITLGTVLSGANTDVIIEYTYQGWYIKIDPEGLTFNMKGNMGWVDISLTMRGDNG